MHICGLILCNNNNNTQKNLTNKYSIERDSSIDTLVNCWVIQSNFRRNWIGQFYGRLFIVAMWLHRRSCRCWRLHSSRCIMAFLQMFSFPFHIISSLTSSPDLKWSCLRTSHRSKYEWHLGKCMHIPHAQRTQKVCYMFYIMCCGGGVMLCVWYVL